MAVVLPLVLSTGGEVEKLQSADQVGITVVSDNVTNASVFPIWVTASSGNLGPKVSSTNLFFNPLLGQLSVSGGFIGTFITSSVATYNQPNFFNPVNGDANWAFGIFNSGSSYIMQVKYAEAGDNLRGFRVWDTNALEPVFFTSRLVNWFKGGLGLGGLSSVVGAGNIGLTAIPSTALMSSRSGLIIANSNIVAHNTIGIGKSLHLSQNTIIDAAGNQIYISSSSACQYSISGTGHIWLTAPSGTAGNTATYTEAFRVDAIRSTFSSPAQLKTYTVATLPTGVSGDHAFVSDALGPTFGATVTGGGAVKVPVYSDGTNWKVG